MDQDPINKLLKNLAIRIIIEFAQVSTLVVEKHLIQIEVMVQIMFVERHFNFTKVHSKVYFTSIKRQLLFEVLHININNLNLDFNSELQGELKKKIEEDH